MADNIDVTPGTGATIAGDLIAGAIHQRIKITVGDDGTNDGDVSKTNPLPVVNPTGATIVLGTVIVSNSTVTITGSSVILGTCSTVVLGTCSTTVLGTCSTTILGTSGCVVIGTITVTGSTGVVNYGLQPGRFKGQLNSANVTGATTVVAAVSNATSYISAYMISAAVAGMYWLEDSAATALTPMHHLAATGGVSFTAVEGMPIASAITNTTIALKSSVVGSVGCLVLGYTA
jgi:hypothetical protein